MKKDDSHWEAVRKMKHNSPMRILDAALAMLVILCFLAYIQWPFSLTVTVIDENRSPLTADITVINEQGEVEFSGEGNTISVRLSKGDYTIKAEREGYVTKEHAISNRAAIKWNKDFNEEIQLTEVK